MLPADSLPTGSIGTKGLFSGFPIRPIWFYDFEVSLTRIHVVIQCNTLRFGLERVYTGTLGPTYVQKKGT